MRWFLASLILAVSGAASADGPIEAIDAHIAAELPASGAPGLAYAVIDGDEIHTGARGVRRAGGGDPVTAETPFLLGSISKSFTALAIMTLVEAGEIDLEAGASRYLDAFDGRPGGAVTIRSYLSHTSGYSTLQGNSGPAPGGPDDTIAGRAAWIAASDPATAPETRWAYSNANYLVLGAVIEAVSGQSFESYVETRLLAPMGMTASFVSDGRSHEAMAIGHQPWFAGRRPIADTATDRAMAPAGGVVSTAADMARYLQFMVNGRDDVVSAQAKTMMMRPAGGASPSYGLGWSFDPQSGAAYHAGLTPGVETLAVLRPQVGAAAVVLVNANGGLAFGSTNRLLYGVTARALDLAYEGETAGWGAKALFAGFLFLPVFFLSATATAILKRQGLRAKSGVFGLFSLWFPLAATLALAWTSLHLIPRLFGVPLATLGRYQPDFTLLLAATALTSVVWAVARLILAYGGGLKRKVGRQGE